MASRSRRARQNRHQGSGRVTTRRPIQLNRHSQFGISAPTRSALDESEDFEDVDEFFFRNSSTAESTPGTALSEGSPGSSDGEATTTASSQRTRRRASAESTSKKKTPGKARRTPTPRTASPKKRLSFGGSSVSPAEQSDMGGGEQPDDFDDDFDDHGDDGFDDEEAEEEGLSPEPPRDHGRRKHAKAKAVDLDSPEVGQPSAKKGRGSSAKGAKQNKGKKKTPQKRKAPQPRTFSTPDPNLLDNSIDEDAPDRLQPLDNDRPPTPGVRRSKRARYKPLAHWKNERVTTSVFHTKDGHLAIKTKAQRDGVPTPVIKRGRNQGGASTPFAKRNELKGKKAGGSKATKSSAGRKKGASAEKDEPAPVILPDGFEESDQTVMPILVKNADGDEVTQNLRVVRRGSKVTFRQLSSSDSPDPATLAVGTFERDQFLAGMMTLVPQAQKAAENVRKCNQVYHVAEAQDKSLEVTINRDRHFLLSAGDQFFVPPHCEYSLKNHSKSVEAKLSFVVIKPPIS